LTTKLLLPLLVLWPWMTQSVALAQALAGPRAAAIPERPRGAPTGSVFIERVGDLSDEARERAVLRELRRGNVPSFLRQLRPVDVVASSPDGRAHRGRFWTMPDYLAIGADDDFVRIPMSPITAQLIADQFDCLLPTRKMVDEVFHQSRIHLTPEPLPAGPGMTSSEYFLMHNELITAQLTAAQLAAPQVIGEAPGALVSGHKKDVVITNRLQRSPARVAIYGWHRSDGEPIQSLSLIHPNWYVDYSHGVRLVASLMLVDGAPRLVAEVLKDPSLAPLLSDEGPLPQPRLCTDRDRHRCRAARRGGLRSSGAHLR